MILKETSFKRTEIDWIPEVPSHWEIKKLKFSDEIIMGQSPNSNSYNEIKEGIPFLQGNAEFGEINPIENIYTSEPRKIAPKGSVLYSVRAPIGAVNIADKDYCIGRGLCAIKAKQSNQQFLFYIALALKQELNSLGTGSTFTAISVSDISNMKVAFPPLKEQEIIVHYLDTETEKINRFILTKQNFIDLLKEQRQSIITNAVTKGINENTALQETIVGEIPTNWKVRRLKFLAAVRFSTVDKHSLEDEAEVKLCNYLDVYSNEYIKNDFDFMKATASEAEIKKFTVEKGDIMITKDSETPEDIAVPAMVVEELENVVCGYHLAHIKPKKDLILSEFLFRLFQSKKINSHFEVSALGVTRYGLSYDDINSVYLPYPDSLQEQQEIISYIKSETKTIDTAIAKAEKEIELIKEYKEAMIAEAVMGKINITNC